MEDYSEVQKRYEPGKVVVAGANGKVGKKTLKHLMTEPKVSELVGIVRTEEKKEKLEHEISAYRERSPTQNYTRPRIAVADPNSEIDERYREAIAEAEVWINWKGLSMESLRNSTDRKLSDIAEEKGMQERDLLLGKNLEITLDDAQMAFDHSPNTSYIVGINPVDVLVRSVHKYREEKAEKGKYHGENDGNSVLSTGAQMEYQRLNKLMAKHLESEFDQHLSFDKANGMAIGEHGDNVVFYNLSLGGVSAEDYLAKKYSMHGSNNPREDAREAVEEIYEKVTTEAIFLRGKTGDTPYIGPSKVSSDLAQKLLSNGGKENTSVCTYHEEYGPWRDVAMTVPTEIGKDYVEPIELEFISNPELTEEQMEVLDSAVEHLSEVNKRADELYQQWKEEKFGKRW
ncbi:MAG: hypothetical protein SVV03_01815 [Candidatus Nanohaloarchaea archaeon]|nr:hypothetical protein [Candidatus Nanohaloarchaea archaeon]